MRTLNFKLLVMAAMVVFCVAIPSQGARYLIPERIERATEEGDDGLQQWAAWPKLKCPSCKGVGKSTCATCARFPLDAKECPECNRAKKLLAPCRVCAGKGTIADPLKFAPCAGCMGAGILICTVCGGGGEIKVGSAKRFSSCPSCRAKGAFPCTGCKGSRQMASLQLKPSMAEAPLDKLKKAMKDLDKTIKMFNDFVPVADNKTRKQVKSLEKAYQSAKKIHPGFKDLAKLAKSYMSKVFAGAQFQGHQENEANTMNRLKANADYFLKVQKRMMELAIKRAEANAGK
jgi:hypothetical protein